MLELRLLLVHFLDGLSALLGGLGGLLARYRHRGDILGIDVHHNEGERGRGGSQTINSQNKRSPTY